MKVARIIPLSLLVSLFLPGAKGQTNHSSPQLHFSAEDEGTKSSAVIPPAVWETLIHDPDVRTVMKSAKHPLHGTPRSWFGALQVSLHGSEDHDLVVQGEDQLQGANVTTFWLFLQTPKGPRLVLKIPAHDLVIKSVELHGYNTIDAFSTTAINTSKTSFCFDGQRYMPCSSR